MGNSTNALPVAKKGMKKGWKIALIVMSAVFFKEKMTPKCIIGILIAFTGLIFINVL